MTLRKVSKKDLRPGMLVWIGSDSSDVMQPFVYLGDEVASSKGVYKTIKNAHIDDVMPYPPKKPLDAQDGHWYECNCRRLDGRVSKSVLYRYKERWYVSRDETGEGTGTVEIYDWAECIEPVAKRS